MRFRVWTPVWLWHLSGCSIAPKNCDIFQNDCCTRIEAMWRIYASANQPSLVQIMACCLARRQALIWINDGILLIGPLGTNFSEILIKIHTSSFKKIHLKMSSGKWWSFCLSLNVLTSQGHFGILPWISLMKSMWRVDRLVDGMWYQLTHQLAYWLPHLSPSDNLRRPWFWFISPWAKWPPFRRRYFQMHFHE